MNKSIFNQDYRSSSFIPQLSFALANSVFDDTYNNFNHGEKSFPLTNILVSKDSDIILIEMAVAGFKPDDISIDEVDNKITVIGKRNTIRESVETDWKYEKREIANRDFKRVWSKKPEFKIEEAAFENGILTIKIVKDDEIVKRIPIIVRDSLD